LPWIPDRTSCVGNDTGRASSLVRIAARFQRAEGHGRRAADPNFYFSRSPGASCAAISVPCVPRLRGPGLAFYRHLGTLKRTEPRTGRSAGRAGYSAPHILHARRFRRARVSTKTPVCKGLPRRAYRNRTPQAPLPARRSGTDLPDLPLSGRERVWSIGILSGRQEHYSGSFLEMCRDCHLSEPGALDFAPSLWSAR
jgi:hypothetical protein